MFGTWGNADPDMNYKRFAQMRIGRIARDDHQAQPFGIFRYGA
jgi:hypothetical protein